MRRRTFRLYGRRLLRDTRRVRQRGRLADIVGRKVDRVPVGRIGLRHAGRLGDGQSEHAVLPRRRAVRQSARQRRRSGAGRQGASVCRLLVRQLPLERRKNLPDALLGGRNRQRRILVAPDLHHEKERRILPQLRTRAARSGDHRSRAGRQARRNLFGENLYVPRRGGILAADADLHDFGVVCRQHRRRGPDRRRADSAAARRHGADDGARPNRARRTRTAQQLSRIRHFGPPELHHRFTAPVATCVTCRRSTRVPTLRR